MESFEEKNQNGAPIKVLKRAFGFGQSAEVVLFAFIAALVFQIFAIPLFKDEGVYTWVVVILNQVVFFGAVLIFCKVRSVSFFEMSGARRPPKPKYFLLIVPIAFFSVASFAPIASLFTRWIAKAGYSYSPDYHINFFDPAIFTLSLLALAILPAIAEECLMRGALLSGTKKRSPLFALLYTSFIFALFHGNAVQLVHQFLLAMTMGYLALVTRSVWSSFAIHFLNNATALLLDHGYLNGWIGEGFYSYFSAKLPAGAFAPFFALSWVFLLGALFAITLLLKRDKEEANGAPYEKARGGGVSRINAFLTYLSSPSEKDKEREAENEKIRFLDDEIRLAGEGVLHIVLVAILIAVVVLGVISEVLK